MAIGSRCIIVTSLIAHPALRTQKRRVGAGALPHLCGTPLPRSAPVPPSRSAQRSRSEGCTSCGLSESVAKAHRDGIASGGNRGITGIRMARSVVPPRFATDSDADRLEGRGAAAPVPPRTSDPPPCRPPPPGGSSWRGVRQRGSPPRSRDGDPLWLHVPETTGLQCTEATSGNARASRGARAQILDAR